MAWLRGELRLYRTRCWDGSLRVVCGSGWSQVAGLVAERVGGGLEGRALARGGTFRAARVSAWEYPGRVC